MHADVPRGSRARVFLPEVDVATWIFEARRSRPGLLFALAHLAFRTRPFLFDDHDMPLADRDHGHSLETSAGLLALQPLQPRHQSVPHWTFDPSIAHVAT